LKKSGVTADSLLITQAVSKNASTKKIAKKTGREEVTQKSD